MGRRPWSNRLCVEDCLALDMLVVKYLMSEPSGWNVYRWPLMSDPVPEIGYRVAIKANDGATLVVRYTVRLNGTQFPMEYSIRTTQTSCRYGGRRFWFVCPAVKSGIPCAKRVRKLYLPPGGRVFGCRPCYRLTHRSAQQHDKRVDASKWLAKTNCKNRTFVLYHLHCKLRSWPPTRRPPFSRNDTGAVSLSQIRSQR